MWFTMVDWKSLTGRAAKSKTYVSLVMFYTIVAADVSSDSLTEPLLSLRWWPNWSHGEASHRVRRSNSPLKLIHPHWFIFFSRRWGCWFNDWQSRRSDTSDCVCACACVPIIGNGVSDLHPSLQFSFTVTLWSSFLLLIRGTHYNHAQTHFNQDSPAIHFNPMRTRELRIWPFVSL